MAWSPTCASVVHLRLVISWYCIFRFEAVAGRGMTHLVPIPLRAIGRHESSLSLS